MEKLTELDREGKNFEEVVRLGCEYMKRTRLFFALKSLHNLAQNGRVSKVVAGQAAVVLGKQLFLEQPARRESWSLLQNAEEEKR